MAKWRWWRDFLDWRWWWQFDWGGNLPGPYMYIGPLLIVWSNPNGYKTKGWYWPRDVRFAWFPD